MPPKTGLMTTKSADQLASRQYVYTQLLDDYPPSAAKWVKTVPWSGPQVVPIDSIDMSNSDSWVAADEPDKVSKFADKIDAGRLKPILVVRKPDVSRMIVIDGHHRLLAYKKRNRDPLCWIGDVPKTVGPWDEMHANQSGKK